MDKILQRVSKDIRGLFYLCAGLFLALSLFSYDASDPSLNSIGMSGEVHNYCGFVGAMLADLLYQIFGMGSWVAVLILARAAFLQWTRPRKSAWSEKVFLMLTVVNFSSLLQLYWGEVVLFGGQVQVGGWVGFAVSSGFVRAFNVVGAGLILWCFFSVSLLFLTQMNLLSLWDRALAGMGSAFGFLGEGLKKFWGLLKWPKLPKLALPKRAAANGSERREPVLRREPSERAVPERVMLPLQEEPVVLAARRKVKLKTRVARRVENWKLPDLQLLEDPPASRYKVDDRECQKKSKVLTDKLSQFSVAGEVTDIKPGPSVTMFEFRPRSDVKISKITELADDLSLALSSESVRIIAPIPGRDVVGIETANAHRETVYLKDIIASEDFWSESKRLPLALGRQADGLTKVVDLRTMPHLLVAGTTGSGKSVFVVSLITGLLFRHSPKTLRVILIDPKQVDLSLFSEIPHLLMPVIHDAPKAVAALKWAVHEMEKRYRSMSKFGARGLEAFNEIVAAFDDEEMKRHEEANEQPESEGGESYYFQPQPYIAIVVEEFGDLMTVDKGQVETLVVRLAQMARACGIHLILAMQSPRKDVVTGLIKTNIPGRISFKVASKMDSRIILDDSGAERLLARGDMLFLAPGVAKPERHHGPWLSEDEISQVTQYWAGQGEPEFHGGAMQALEGPSGGVSSDPFSAGEEEYDERYDEILAWTSTMKEVSASLLQRKFRLGYPRAARLVEIFEQEGVLGPANGSKPRKVLITSYEEADHG